MCETEEQKERDLARHDERVFPARGHGRSSMGRILPLDGAAIAANRRLRATCGAWSVD